MALIERRNVFQYLSCTDLHIRSRSPVFVHSLSSEALHAFESLTMFPFLGICTTIFSVASSSLVQREAQVSNIHILPASFNLPSRTASTVLPENTLPSATLSAQSISLFNVSSKDSTPPNNTELVCNDEFGQGLTVASCAQARSHLIDWLNSLARQNISIGQQGQGVWDVYDQIKFLSCELTQNL